MPKVVKKCISLTLIIALGGLQLACSAFTGSRQTFSVNTPERDAQIYINGELKGVGNAKATVPRDETVSVMVKKEGFYPASREVGTKMSTTGICDLISGCLFIIPFIGLLFPGSHELDQNNITVILEKEVEADKKKAGP